MVDCHKCQRFNACYDDDDECIGFVPKTMTNADRIRAMTDEELAKFLLEFEYHESNLYCMKLNSCTWDDPCADCLREWLKKEVDDD